MKRAFVASAVLAAALASTHAAAGDCGYGKIVDLKEGGWAGDGLGIALAQSADGQPGPQNNGDNTKKQNNNGTPFTYYDASQLGAGHIDAIRRLATLAFAMDATIQMSASGPSCSNATELSILR